jgi:hypothetical protein
VLLLLLEGWWKTLVILCFSHTKKARMVLSTRDSHPCMPPNPKL